MKEKMLPNKQENEKIKLAIISLYEMKNKFKKVKQNYEEKNKKLDTEIKNFMFVHGIDALNFQSQIETGTSFGVKEIKVDMITPKTVIFDADKLEKKLDKQLCKKIIDKEYTINDFEGLIAYLKECDVDPKIFKEFIDVKKVINKTELDNLSDLGEITKKELNGCYEVVERTGYIKISVVEDK